MRRLYWRIYLSFLGVVGLFLLFIAIMGVVAGPGRAHDRLIEAVAATVAELLPVGHSSAQPGAAGDSLARLSRRFDAVASLHAPDGTLIARAGPRLPAPPREGASRWVRDAGVRAFALALPDGRWLVASRPRERSGAPTFLRHWPWVLAALGLAIALGAHPMARRITRRLERLQLRVDQLGGGDLSARVEVEGRDEVAELARSFNRSAQRIEALVQAQRSMLASASHELRSPLARIRMALALIGDGARPQLVQQMEQDIEELDDLIEELLLASRLQAGAAAPVREPVALHALLQEEAARVGAAAVTEDVTVQGNPRALRRMLRNLLENARRHGDAEAVQAMLSADADGVVVRIEDGGPGVSPEYRERIFEPFYRPQGTHEGRDGGVGLGLALVRQIARHHGGDVSYEPREGGGSRFRVTLPPA
jgi:signal transduction histidine kinase